MHCNSSLPVYIYNIVYKHLQQFPVCIYVYNIVYKHLQQFPACIYVYNIVYKHLQQYPVCIYVYNIVYKHLQDQYEREGSKNFIRPIWGVYVVAEVASVVGNSTQGRIKLFSQETEVLALGGGTPNFLCITFLFYYITISFSWIKRKILKIIFYVHI